MTDKNPAAVALGSLSSPRKAASSAHNGASGGRPRQTRTFGEWWATVEKPDEGCWLPPSSLPPSTQSHGGYRTIAIDGRVERAHRAVFEHFNGPIPDGLLIRHTCDNRGCCRPDHLLTGTPKENATDRVERGRVGRTRSHPDYIIRDINMSLWARVKARAASEGRPLRFIILALLTAYADHGFTVTDRKDA